MTNQPNSGIIDKSEKVCGRCHVCQNSRPIRYCGICKHWFCDDCRRKPFDRAGAALKEFIHGRQPDCCGVY